MKHTNRLVDATSPYLLQHAHNPVDWYPWGEEALARARAEDKPILLSIGYSACHWCHVMERESFENETIAAVMNREFVSIKVDREERPDLDAIYMAATLAMNQGQGGWPMTVFLTPDQEPFFAGTYFPPEDRYGRPGFRSLLEGIAEQWRRDPADMRAHASELAQLLRANMRAAHGPVGGEAELKRALVQFAQDFDARLGGFGGAPKFPPATAIRLLFRLYRATGDAQALVMAEKTLEAMAEGGLYDQVGGGFHRYSTDEYWLVPHFEKMLYDNALLVKAYLEAYQVTQKPLYARVAREVLEYVLRDMTAPAGGFYSATDADSEGEEGKFFVWSPDELVAVLGEEDARIFGEYYDISERGNWEGKSIPNVSRSGPRVATRLQMSPEDLWLKITALRTKVYEARQDRVAPGLDDKILTAWNGLMIGAMAEGARVLGDEAFLAGARRAADFVFATHRKSDGRLLRTSRDGRAHLDGYLEDYAYLTEGLIDLYEAGGGDVYLTRAVELAERTIADFSADEGGFFATAVDHERLILRHREGHDGATPSPNAVAAHALVRLSRHLGRSDFDDAAVGALRAYGKAVGRQPRAFAQSLIVAGFLLEGPVELALIGREDDRGLGALAREVARHYLPNRVIEYGDPERPAGPERPLLAGKGLVGGRAALYVCRDFACQAPVVEPEEVPAALAVLRDQPAAARAMNATGRAGRATTDGTAGYAARVGTQRSAYGLLGSTGLSVSRLGFGSYRVDDEAAEHHQALVRALTSGCNLVDTSTNYTDGGSETMIGEALDELLQGGDLRREEVVVVSKIGYVQGENLALAEEREAAGRPFPEMVKYADGIWHGIHPEFLADQLDRSLGRLQLATLDVCLLHNPEYFLKDGHERSHGTLEQRREEFYTRLGAAFSYLESQVAAGRIGFYGVSSNSCTSAATDPEFTSLTRMLETAHRVVGEGHHFRVLQLPMNLLEPAAVLEKNNGPDLSETVLQAAARAGIGVLVNRPLNAITADGMLRLVDPPRLPHEVDFEMQRHRLGELEGEYRQAFAPYIRLGEGQVHADDLFRWSVDLADLPSRLSGLDHWDALEQQRILPQLVGIVRALDDAMSGPMAEPWTTWRDRYLAELQKLFMELRRRAAEKTRAHTTTLLQAIDPLLPAERRVDPLARKALWVVASTPGVSSVLNGMRRVAYVEEALGVLPWPPLADVAPVYAAVRNLRL
jgi:uncharacterized protein YyaL (SSP411 family)/aryl-alcohol dehydrogenase-like predicted oxidoreductase